MFLHFLNKRRSFGTTLSLLSLTGLLGCASTGSPGGGLYDEEPPFLVKSEPFEGATSVMKQKIVMRFNENIKLDNANEKLTISPPQEKAATITSNAKTLTIELQDTLKPNTTYTIDLGDAVQDNNEGNPMENLTLTFSTGDHIDTMKVMGTLLNAADLEPISGAFVGIYALQEDGTFPHYATEGDSLLMAHDSIIALYPDSIFSLRPLERAGKTDAKGRFTISGVAPGRYRMYALKDGNTNYKYDTFDEDIAYVDTLISPWTSYHHANDTIWNRYDTTLIDSVHMHMKTDYYPNDLCLRMFNEGRVNRYLDELKWRDSTTITLRFASKMPEPPHITLLGEEELGAAAIDKDAWMICEDNMTHDTLTYWLRDSLIYHRDTLQLAITYPFTQNGIDVMRTDTIELERPVIASNNESKSDSKGKNDGKKPKKGRKQKEAEAPVDSLPKTVFMTLKLLQNTLEIGGRPQLEASAPIDTIDFSHLKLSVKKDTLWQELDYELVQDSLNLRRYTLHAKPHFSPGGEYQLIADSAAMADVYGHPLDALKLTFNEKKTEQYAHLLFNIQGITGPAFVQLLNEKDVPVKQAEVKNGQAKFPQAPVGKYYARLVVDRNGNGKFDVGSLTEHTQPEEVYYFSKLIEMRENWQYSETWDVFAYPLTQQKPEELIQNKPKEKQKRKNRNEEYLKQHPKSKKG